MNIVVVTPFWPRHLGANGIVTYCDNLVNALKKQGHNVFVLANGGSGAGDGCIYVNRYKLSLFEKIWVKIGEFFSKGYYEYYFGSRSMLGGIRDIEKKHKIDVLEIEESFGWHYFLQKKVCFPVVMRLHGPHYVNGMIGDKVLTAADDNRLKREERAFKAARYVNSPSHWVLNSVQEKYRIKWPLQAVFSNPISLVKEDGCWSPSSYIKNQILFVGRFDAHKGGDIVVQAFAKVLNKIPDATLVFVGQDRGIELADGNKMYVNDAVDQYVAADKKASVNYLGLMNNEVIKELRRTSQLTVMASRNEIFGYTVVESLASAAPIIAPYVGGVKEIIENEVSGVFFQPLDVNELAEKIILLLSDPKKLASLSRCAYARCRENFSSFLVAEQAVEFYQKSISFYDS